MASKAMHPSAGPSLRPTHCIVANGEEFHVDVRYSNLNYIARGAYGMVCIADDAVRASCA